MKNLILSISLLLVTACAYTPQDANIAPTINLAASNIGNNTEVAVKVVDERTTKTIGHRGAALFKGAKITTDQDIPSMFHSAFSSALQTIGFSPVTFKVNHPNPIRIDLRELNYYTSTGFWTGGVHTKAAAKITAGNSIEPFEKMYTSENEKRVVFVPGANKNERMLNETVSSLISKIVSDQNLIGVLTSSTAEEPES